MSLTRDPAVCAEIEGLLCLSDLPELAQQPLCSADDPCLHFFQGMGFRPAAWATERDQYGDRSILIVSGDDAYMSKYDFPFDAMASVPTDGLIPLPPAAPLPQVLAIPGGAPATPIAGGFPGFPGFPWFPGGSNPGPRPTDEPATPTPPTAIVPGPIIPGPIIPGPTVPGGGTPGTTPPDNNLPPITPIPLTGSGLFLLAAMAALMIKAAHGRLVRQAAWSLNHGRKLKLRPSPTKMRSSSSRMPPLSRDRTMLIPATAEKSRPMT